MGDCALYYKANHHRTSVKIFIGKSICLILSLFAVFLYFKLLNNPTSEKISAAFLFTSCR